jgi:hypothetical protein
MQAALLDSSVKSITKDSLVKGQKYSALVAEVDPQRSCPIQLSLSPFLTGFVPFYDVAGDLEAYDNELVCKKG